MTSISGIRHVTRLGTPGRVRAALGTAILGLVLILLAACGSSSSSAQSDAQQASDLLNQGLQAAGRGDNSTAADDYKKCLSHDPKNKFCSYNLGVIDQGAGRLDSAETYYRTVLTIDPDFVDALYNLALIRQKPSPSEAENLYRHAISVKPDFAAAHLNLGFFLRDQGRTAEGNAELLKAVQLDPALQSRIPAGLNLNPPAPQPSPTR